MKSIYFALEVTALFLVLLVGTSAGLFAWFLITLAEAHSIPELLLLSTITLAPVLICIAMVLATIHQVRRILRVIHTEFLEDPWIVWSDTTWDE